MTYWCIHRAPLSLNCQLAFNYNSIHELSYKGIKTLIFEALNIVFRGCFVVPLCEHDQYLVNQPVI